MRKELAREAVELVLPAIFRLLEHYAKRKHLCIVVMDPGIKPWEGSFEKAVLYQHRIGNPAEWEHDYQDIARSKAQQAWRNGQANIITQMLGPANLKTCDTVYWGSFEYQGVIVAASGIQPWFDMLVSAWVAVAIQQIAQNRIQIFKETKPKANFLDLP